MHLTYHLNNMAILLDTIISGNTPGGGGSSGGGYVVWDPEIVKSGFTFIKETVGKGFNIGLWVFLMLSGIYLLVSIVRSLFG